MAGHSKWAQIKRSKGAKDVKRGALFAKMARMIIIAAKTGGDCNPDHNFKLRTAIDKAKAAGVPNDNIKRAVEKAGGNGEGSELKEITYEGYLPGGIAVMVQTATDNSNRTYSEVRNIFTKADGSLGTPGCVAYMFNNRGEIHIESSVEFDESNDEVKEEILNLAIEAGANDIDCDADKALILCDSAKLEEISSNLQSSIENAKLTEKYKVLEVKDALAPSTTILVNKKEDAEKILKAMNQLEDHEDVVDLIANFDIEESLI